MTTYIVPYSPKSKGAKILSQLTGFPLLKPSRLAYLTDSLVIHWGRVNQNTFLNLNCNSSVNSDTRSVVNKLRFYKALSVTVPDCTAPYLEVDKNSDFIITRAWIRTHGVNNKFVVYKYVESHSGKGVSILTGKEILSLIDNNSMDGKLITKYIPKAAEFRVHFSRSYRDVPVLVQQKKLKKDVERTKDTFSIRSHNRGWIFSSNVDNPEHVTDLTKARTLSMFSLVFNVLGIEFGAIDVIITSAGRIVILEINSAPGISSTDTKKYYTDLFLFYNNKRHGIPEGITINVESSPNTYGPLWPDLSPENEAVDEENH